MRKNVGIPFCTIKARILLRLPIENARHDIQQCDGILSNIQEQLSHGKKRIKEAARDVLTKQQEGVLAKTSVDELS